MIDYRIAPPLLILAEACSRHNLEISFIGDESGHLAKISDGEEFFYSGGAETPTYPLNSAVAQDLCEDKGYSLELLSKAGLTVPRGRLFFPGFAKNNHFGINNRGIPEALTYVRDHLSYPVIVKPNRGSMGRGVQIVDNDTDLVLAMQNTENYGHACLLQNLIEGTEYRLFCLNGKPRFLYQKNIPSLIGDGVSTVRELLQKHEKIKVELLNPVHVRDILLRQKSAFVSHTKPDAIWDGILKSSAKVNLTGMGNLAAGASITNFTTEFEPAHHEIAQIVTGTLNVQIFGIDFFMSDKGCTIIEINGNPSLKGAWEAGQKELCINIWSDIFRSVFHWTEK